MPHLDQDPNILDQVETLSTRLKLPHFSRGSSPTCSGSVLRSTTIIPDFSFWNCFKVAFHIFTNGTKTLGLNLTQRFKITDEGTWVYVKSVKSVIKLLPFHIYCKHWKVITIYYSFREDGLANNQTEREHGDVQVKVAIPGNISTDRQFCKSAGRRNWHLGELILLCTMALHLYHMSSTDKKH